jgi:hypothetical protein
MIGLVVYGVAQIALKMIQEDSPASQATAALAK